MKLATHSNTDKNTLIGILKHSYNPEQWLRPHYNNTELGGELYTTLRVNAHGRSHNKSRPSLKATAGKLYRNLFSPSSYTVCSGSALNAIALYNRNGAR